MRLGTNGGSTRVSVWAAAVNPIEEVAGAIGDGIRAGRTSQSPSFLSLCLSLFFARTTQVRVAARDGKQPSDQNHLKPAARERENSMPGKTRRFCTNLERSMAPYRPGSVQKATVAS
ncbi:hypothetical protein FaHV1S18_124 [Falconid herpesvirus 1]|uniref:Uncharacterized protein n=1 Tax=Falconid herpesvirus 1 TaxID=1510155 RepID=A0A068EW81_9ALPH|nr:hypothetical protein FaHV1S18_092 [Falconid herpesvirus 1]YP_009046608.1 hypothetical protein FaHV1S18_124 [Falconid herpesvirus 1]AID52782.1 hypothetical protein FaHV1S18_092 [Falconid herpesvirus 1]AID52814.1 hypothetical protein FaHV1S18_124 [Falconid herpesvirus 1]